MGSLMSRCSLFSSMYAKIFFRSSWLQYCPSSTPDVASVNVRGPAMRVLFGHSPYWCAKVSSQPHQSRVHMSRCALRTTRYWSALENARTNGDSSRGALASPTCAETAAGSSLCTSAKAQIQRLGFWSAVPYASRIDPRNSTKFSSQPCVTNTVSFRPCGFSERATDVPFCLHMGLIRTSLSSRIEAYGYLLPSISLASSPSCTSWSYDMAQYSGEVCSRSED